MRAIKLFGNPALNTVPASNGTGGIGWQPLAAVEINTTGKTSAQIDGLFPTVPANGTVVSDPTNFLLLVRQAGKWSKTAALTQIA